MITTIEILPGVTLRCYPDHRFKQGCLSFAMIRPMCAQEAALNALIPAVLLRGTRQHPDLQTITWKLDDLYGASLSTQVRRVGDYQTQGLYCAFLEDRFAMTGDEILAPMVDFLREVLLEPALENGVFRADYVESEKKNLISTIESELNDKRAYAMGQLLRNMCKADSFGIPRLGDKEAVAAITPEVAFSHYQKALRESPIDLFYVGSAPAETVAGLLKPLFEAIDRDYVNLNPQTSFHDAGGSHVTEEMDVAQGKLCMGYVTPITNRDPEFVAMQVMNTVFGAGMTSKLFQNVREKMSLCYAIGSGYYGSKGILTVSAGIDFDKEDLTRQEVARQLDALRSGDITDEELTAAKEALLSSLRCTHDSPGSIEGYYATAALSGLKLTVDAYMDAVRAVTKDQVTAAAATLQLHTTYFLKGVTR